MATDDLQKSQDLSKDQSQQHSTAMNDYDPDNKSETETKSLSSVKSNGSNPDLRYTYTHFYLLIFLFSLFNIPMLLLFFLLLYFGYESLHFLCFLFLYLHSSSFCRNFHAC